MNRPLAAQGFVAVPPDAWEIAARGLAYVAAEWPEVCVVADLRWWVDQVTARRQASLPTIRALCARWGWPMCRVFRILAEPESWADPKRGGFDQAVAVLAVAKARAPKQGRRQVDRSGIDRERSDIDQEDTQYQPLAEASGSGIDRERSDIDPTRAFPLSPITDHLQDSASTPDGADMSVEDPEPIEDPDAAGKAQQLTLLGDPAPASKASKPAAWRVAIELISAHHRGAPLTPETWQNPITAAMKSTKCSPQELADAYAAVQDPRMRGYEWWRETFPNGGATLFQAFIRSGGQKATQIAGFIEAGREWRAKWAGKIAGPAAEQAPPAPDKPAEETVSQAWLTVQASLRNGRRTDHLSPRTLRALELGWGSVSGALNLLYSADSYTETRVIRPQFESCYQRATA